MSLTFYYAPMSTASTVHWSLEELGVPYEAVRVDLSSPEDKLEKLGPVNPNLKVPVLVHDGVPIFESAAIQIYLGETFGVAKDLYPAVGPERGVAQAWLVWTNVTLGQAAARWIRSGGAAQEAEGNREAKAEFDHLVGFLEDRLEDAYLLGSELSLVDLHLVSFFQWIQFSGFELAAFPRVKAWVDRTSDRPSQRKLMTSA